MKRAAKQMFPKFGNAQNIWSSGVRIGCLVVALTCAAAWPGESNANPLHAGDKIQVTVYNHPELSSDATIQPDGSIDLPMIGRVSAAGHEPQNVAATVTQKLARTLYDPDVLVSMLQPNTTVFIAGGPGGVIAYVPGMTLQSALATAQIQPTGVYAGLGATSDQNSLRAEVNSRIDFTRIAIHRDGMQLGPYALTSRTNPELLPSDTIVLQNKPIVVHVRGEVAAPGDAYLDTDEPLESALTQVGGVLPSSSLSNIQLIRNGTTNTLGLGSQMFTQPAQPGDMILVGHATHVEVLGYVEHPGDVQLRGNTTLVAAIYNAGGLSKNADLQHVQVSHGSAHAMYDITALAHGATEQNPSLLDGDVVFVPEGRKVDYHEIFDGILTTWGIVKLI